MGAVKENVIPGTASAIINHRLMPTTTNTSVLQHYERTIDNPEISINPTNAMPNGWMPASKVAPVDTQGYRAIVVRASAAPVLARIRLISRVAVASFEGSRTMPCILSRGIGDCGPPTFRSRSVLFLLGDDLRNSRYLLS